MHLYISGNYNDNSFHHLLKYLDYIVSHKTDFKRLLCQGKKNLNICIVLQNYYKYVEISRHKIDGKLKKFHFIMHLLNY